MDNKSKIIDEVYRHPIIGFGSVNTTYHEAKSINKDITLKDVKEYFSKLPEKQLRYRYKGYNSFIAKSFLEQIQIDIADFTKNAELNDGYRYCLVGVDVFSRYSWGVPMRTKEPYDVINALKEIIDVIGTPETIYSDLEGSITSNKFKEFVEENEIKLITTLNHAPYAEVFIRTLKQLISNRLSGMKLPKDRWIDVLKPVLAKYNLSRHSSIGMSPFDAKKPINRLTSIINNAMKSKNGRNYKKLKVGDKVRIMIKQTNKTKGTDPRWTEATYKIENIDNGEYMINVPYNKKIYLRHEIREVI